MERENRKEKQNQNKRGITIISKIFLVSQIFFVIGVFCFVYFYAPITQYPYNNQVFNRTDIDFRFRNAQVIIVDDNPDFTSPKEIDFNKINTTTIKFKPGTYYWKAVGIMESSSKSFTINSNVALELDEKNSSLKNKGNVPLNVSVDDSSGLSGLTILDIEVEYPVDAKNHTIYRGEQYGQ